NITSFFVYKDDGSGQFNPSPENLVGSKTGVNLGSDTIIVTVSGPTLAEKFYLSMVISGTWSGINPVNSIKVTTTFARDFVISLGGNRIPSSSPVPIPSPSTDPDAQLCSQ